MTLVGCEFHPLGYSHISGHLVWVHSETFSEPILRNYPFLHNCIQKGFQGLLTAVTDSGRYLAHSAPM